MNRKTLRYTLLLIPLVVILLAYAVLGRLGMRHFDNLYIAAAKGNLARVEKLLSQPGADVNTPSPEGKTALEAAIEAAQTKVALALLDHRPDLKQRNRSGYTPLLQAVSRGEAAIARALLEKGADPNARVGGDQPGNLGETPLILAVQRGDTAMIKLLLENKADPGLTSYGGAKAIDYATEVSNTEAVELLKKAEKQ